MLGETWYAEADTPLGPWVYARKIVTHDRYSFYNPKQHPVFDEMDGRIVYFEGTYVNTFSGNPDKTPRYDYNQIMYRLDLADARLALPVPVYRCSGDDAAAKWATVRGIGTVRGESEIAFFALDRSRDNAIPVFADYLPNGDVSLRVGFKPDPPDAQMAEPCFYALAAPTEPQPATCVPLFEYVSDDGLQREYSIEPDAVISGFHRAKDPLCLVWRNPMRAAVRWPKMRSRSITE